MWRRLNPGTAGGAEGPAAVVLLAESGLGKTRLVQEFYSWLVKHEQTSADSAYWPPAIAQDGNNLHVNPPEGAWNPEAQMPFLWWGIRLSNPQGHNQVTTGALAGHLQPFLVPHVEPFHREQRRRQHLTQIANVGRKALIDVVVDMIPGLSLIKTAGEAGLELKGIHDEWRKDQQVVSAETRRASLAEEVVADLAKLFNGPAGRRVPAVIVIDDAQFSSFDPGMVVFVRSLLIAASAGNWPLLLLLTHWQREWDTTDAAEAASQNTIASALKSTPTNLVEVLRLEPILDLAPALLTRLPGLAPHQLTALLERVGGNPRFLEEVLRLVDLKGRGAFVGRDPSGPLTDTCLNELLAASVGLHELIRLRLAQSPELVQKAVVLAGMQGQEFMSHLVLGTAEALDDDVLELASAVATAERPHSYFASTFPGLGAFVQPIYQEVADQRLDYWYDPDEATRALEQAVRNTLTANPVMELHQILALYDVAVRLFENADADTDRVIALRGLDWLAHYAESRRDTHSVHALALRMARLIKTLGAEQVQHAAEHLSSTDRLLSLFGELEARGEVLAMLVQVTSAAVAEDANSDTLAAHSRAMASLADLCAATGDREGARAAWDGARSATQHLVSLRTAEVEQLPDARAMLELGCEIERRHANWRFSISEFLAAEDGFRAALGMLDELQAPDRPYLAERQTCLLGLAKCHWAANRLEDAESLMRATLDLARQFHQQDPGFATGSALAAVLDNLAQLVIVRAGGPAAEATSLLREALAISLVFGTLLGLLAGFFGGWIDSVITGATETIMALPFIVLAIAVIGALGSSTTVVIMTLGFTGWVGYAKLVRARVMELREEDYVQATFALGARTSRALARHILPNVLPLIIVESTLSLGSLILAEAGLSFLGLGIQPPTPTWGGILSEGQVYVAVAPWIAIFPGILLVLTVLATNFLGDFLRDAVSVDT